MSEISYKAILVELCVKQRLKPPVYKNDYEGPDHNRTFLSTCIVGDISQRGMACEKKIKAEHSAAKFMIDTLQNAINITGTPFDGIPVEPMERHWRKHIITQEREHKVERHVSPTNGMASVVTPPPIEQLINFGGKLTIEEYRNKSGSLKEHPKDSGYELLIDLESIDFNVEIPLVNPNIIFTLFTSNKTSKNLLPFLTLKNVNICSAVTDSKSSMSVKMSFHCGKNLMKESVVILVTGMDFGLELQAVMDCKLLSSITELNKWLSNPYQ